MKVFCYLLVNFWKITVPERQPVLVKILLRYPIVKEISRLYRTVKILKVPSPTCDLYKNLDFWVFSVFFDDYVTDNDIDFSQICRFHVM